MEEKLRYDIDLEQFWKDDEIAHRENCFYADAPQVAFGLGLYDEDVFAELDVPGEPHGDNPPELMYEYRCRYNDKAERIIGKRILREAIPSHEIFPAIKLHGEVFGGQYVYKNEMYWLESDIKTPQALETMLDNVDRMDLRAFILPPNWEAEKKRIFEETGQRPWPWFYGRRVRGPVTLAMSIYGVENTVFLMYDEPDLAGRFFQSISDVLMGYAKIAEEEAGEALMNSRHWGYRFNDDNCCMLTAELYEEFAYPVLKRMFDYTCPDPVLDRRFQHSDSEMSHLLPVLSRLNFTGVNFGPTVLFDKIRAHMPNTCVEGCLDPMLLLSNDEEAVIAQVRRDIDMVKASGTKGLCIDAAGSVNNGTKLTTVRAIIYAIQRYGRY